MSQEKDLLQDFVSAKKILIRIKEDEKNAQAVFDERERKLLDYLTESDKDATAKYEGIGYAMSVKPRLYASCVKADEPALFDFLKSKDRADLIKEVVQSGSLSTFTKELVENGEPIPECISYYFKNSIRVYE